MIADLIQETMRTGLDVFSKATGHPVNTVQLVLNMPNESEINYFYCVDFVVHTENGETKYYTFNQVIDKKFDIRQREYFLKQYLPFILKGKATAHGCEIKDFDIFMTMPKEKVHIHLFKGQDCLDELDIAKLLGM